MIKMIVTTLLVVAPYCVVAQSVHCNNPVTVYDIKNLLQQHANTLNPALIKTTESIFSCAKKINTLCNKKLTLIDYSLPSNKKRMWIFDLSSRKLLFNTYVSHGIKSGVSEPRYFTNAYNSKASSIGVFVTGKDYNGRDGLSLRLTGLEKNFNDLSTRRSVVMHSAWYVNEDFIRKYGRAGRSWGCPAIPSNQVASVIDSIKDESLMVIYYPNDQWLSTSRYLTCDLALLAKPTNLITPKPEVRDLEMRGDILYGDVNKTNKLDANVPIMCMSVTNYKRVFKVQPPLSRMLRKQINQTEYIALNLNELRQAHAEVAALEFFLPELIRIGSYHRTEFKSANLGKVTQVDLSGENPVVVTEKSRITFKPTNEFIRWIGL